MSPAKSEDTFRLKISGSNEEFLRTGDLGFMHKGELFVVSRIKDTIIIRGRNIYPFDVEEICKNISPYLSSESIAAFPIKINQSEGLAVAIEMTRTGRHFNDFSETIKDIRSAIVRELGIAPSKIYLVRPGAIPKTTSGKVMRAKTKSMAEKGIYDCLLYTSPSPRDRG